MIVSTIVTNSYSAIAHPHVFIKAKLSVSTTADGLIRELEHVWKFDPFFSSTLLLQFDIDRDISKSLWQRKYHHLKKHLGFKVAAKENEKIN